MAGGSHRDARRASGRHLRDLDLPVEGSLLIVDQCEQAFAADDPAEIREFFDALSQHGVPRHARRRDPR